ncbi:MAG: periplasmic heavy metal sensor [Candidatus Sericytochromatia bacterium]|nr:periplasmic heavy metal sensor [Candidatus Sericytochromatia bacterium]
MLFKKLKINTKLLFTTLLVMISFASPVFADSDNRKLPRPPVESSGSLIINWPMLNLNASQRERIRLLKVDFQRQSIKLKAEIDLKQLDIEKLLVAPNSDPDQIRKLLKDRLSYEAKLRTQALENFLSIKSLLNSDQLAKLPRAVNLR